MRHAASLAVDLYYQGINDATSAANAGMKWWPANVKAQTNAAGIYDPKTGKFRAEKSSETKLKPYGKGTEKDGGTLLVVGNANGAYQPSADYTNGIVMVSIFPYAKSPYIDVYWKDKNGSVGYIGGQINGNTAKHSLRIYVD